MERGLIAERKNWQQLRYRWLIDSRAEFRNFLLRHCPAFVRLFFVSFPFSFRFCNSLKVKKYVYVRK